MKRSLPLLMLAMLIGGCADSKLANWADERHAVAQRNGQLLTKRVQRYAPPVHDPQRIARESAKFAEPRVREVAQGVKDDLTWFHHVPRRGTAAFIRELDTVEPYLQHSAINVHDWIRDQYVDSHELLIGPVD